MLGVFVERAMSLKAGSKEVVETKVEEKVEKEDDGKVSKKDQQRARAFCERAEKLLKSGKEQEAIKHFVQALSLDPNHQESLHQLAMLYLSKEMFNPAIELFRQLGEMTDDPVHYSHMGFAHFSQNDFEGARDAYQRAVELDDSRPQRFVSLAQVYRALEQPNHAVMALDKALAMEPDNRDYLFLMTELKKETEKKDEAIEILKYILELDPENMEAKILLDDLEA